MNKEVAITITLKEYEELLIIKKKYEELKDNWNKLKKLFYQKYYNGERIDTKDILDKMQELERGDK